MTLSPATCGMSVTVYVSICLNITNFNYKSSNVNTSDDLFISGISIYNSETILHWSLATTTKIWLYMNNSKGNWTETDIPLK